MFCLSYEAFFWYFIIRKYMVNSCQLYGKHPSVEKLFQTKTKHRKQGSFWNTIFENLQEKSFTFHWPSSVSELPARRLSICSSVFSSNQSAAFRAKLPLQLLSTSYNRYISAGWTVGCTNCSCICVLCMPVGVSVKCWVNS